uniref:Uncharacterized protein n=1 Tax=Lepeophtheirus salmonis TaxID=72036 RepID=A0A0K2TVU8_LEPSM
MGLYCTILNLCKLFPYFFHLDLWVLKFLTKCLSRSSF